MIFNCLTSHLNCFLVAIDFEKAFDSVSHMLYYLRHYNGLVLDPPSVQGLKLFILTFGAV